ncbi:hypothetical protein EGI26_02405 [Lacihabitans sp. CCS-44]|uniref:hypothetical protein n=1 Tax=Lacihabitans sp. CCS-44 TaxID=2487331 RepID=UPI0020CF97E9|nr:hypothetical protein [Lacihabitans sp. CCS-44]MCP9754013.1 hypothetical protein [Lacihabitans sp. CCS-44]
MKKLLTLTFLLVFGQVYCQDFIKKSDGTYEQGEVISLENNILKFISKSSDTLVFNVEDLAVIHISKEGFVMKNLQLQNAQFKSNQYGTTIILPENSLKNDKKLGREQRPMKNTSKS